MRIGVISDTHDYLSPAEEAIEQMGAIDALIFAGDCYSDLAGLSPVIKVPLYAVPGNSDRHCQAPEELTVTLEGCKVLITHGHRYRVKKTLTSLYFKAQELGVQGVVFGHTHEQLNISEQGICLFNPGSTLLSCYGILHISSKGVEGELFTITQKNSSELRNL